VLEPTDFLPGNYIEMCNSEGKKIKLIVRKIRKDRKVVSLDRPWAASLFRILDILSP
jgi:hypothetical protein